MRQSKSEVPLTLCIGITMVIIFIVMLYPFYFTIIASFSDPYKVAKGKVFLYPTGIMFDAYRYTFQNNEIWRGYINSMYYTVIGTLFNLFLTIPAAYVMSKKELFGRRVLAWFFLIPMYFSGGLIPSYILVMKLGLLNKPYTLIFLGGISIFNMIVTRVYFQTSIPDSLYEAARIDGAGEIMSFFRIAIPLAGPIIAVMTLYYAVGHWNDYYTALIYLQKRDYLPLQSVLRGILIQNQNAIGGITPNMLAEQLADNAKRAYIAEAMKYSLIVVSSLPMLIVYPFIQKHFVKGIMIGSLKG
jgi:putative aldouronate transport system permease protein